MVINCPMTPLHIRRATVDDRPPLKALWSSMQLAPEELEKRLTEFQVAENSDGEMVGAIGIQCFGSHALLHSEGYSDYGAADAARQLFWERIQTLAANHGVFRVWTQEQSPFWKNYGFLPPTAETLLRLPEAWRKESEGSWITLQLKDEELLTAVLEKQSADFLTAGKRQADRVTKKVQTLKLAVTLLGFFLGAVGFGIAAYLFFHRHPFSG